MWLLLGMVFANPIPLYPFPYSCIDPRFPTIHKGWIVGCNPQGEISELYHVESMRRQRLQVESEFVGFDPIEGKIMHGRAGVWDLKSQEQQRFPRITEKLSAPAMGKNGVWAYTTETSISIIEGRKKIQIEAYPRGWYPPAWWGNSIVWVEDDGSGGEDLWMLTDRQQAQVLRGGDIAQRHPVGSGDRLAWIEGERVGIWTFGEPEAQFFPASVVDRLALSAERLCWSQRGVDIDIHCADGFSLERPGNQIWPAIWEGFLLFREGEQLMLYRFEEE